MVMEGRLMVNRLLPDGSVRAVTLYHVSLEGLESALICRDEEDYDHMVKNIFLRALGVNVIVVIYGVVSNHAHVAILAASMEDAVKFANEVKKVQSMWLRRKYGEINLMLGHAADVTPVVTIQHARNVLAYIPRNALDNGADNVELYKWTGYRGMFCNGAVDGRTVRVSELSTRKVESIMHTGTDLSGVSWLLNERGEIEPASACDWRFLEALFNHDQAFFMRKIGDVNSAEITFRQSIEKSRKMTDGEFLKYVDSLSVRWYQSTTEGLSPAQKIKFLEYISKKVNLSVPQVARCLKLDRNTVAKVLGRK